ncbi:MAG: hypothetical protein ACOX2G_04005 [Bacillota bacterium]|jgi:hypothetical protein
MNKKGAIALEAILASGLTLVLLTILASLSIVFWQSWHETTQDNRQRQWAAMAFEYLDRDIAEASRVRTTTNEIQVKLPNDEFVYRLSGTDHSFYRGQGKIYYALALVESVNWWWEGELLWVQLNFPDESYRCCYYIPEDKR